MLSSNPRIDSCFVIDERKKDEVKLVGVTFKTGWKMDNHISTLTNKSKNSFRLAGLTRLKPYLTKKHLVFDLDCMSKIKSR